MPETAPTVESGRRMADFDLAWLEEPIRADEPAERFRVSVA